MKPSHRLQVGPLTHRARHVAHQLRTQADGWERFRIRCIQQGFPLTAESAQQATLSLQMRALRIETHFATNRRAVIDEAGLFRSYDVARGICQITDHWPQAMWDNLPATHREFYRRDVVHFSS